MKSNDPKRKATTLYYKGRVADDMYHAEEATTYYLQAKEIAKEIKDYKLAQVICANLGMVYAYRNLGDLAMSEIKDAYSYSVLMNDSTSISYMLSYLGRVSGVHEKWDSCIYYYSQAIEIAEQSNNLRTLGLALGEVAYAYEQLHQNDAAIQYLKRAENIKVENGHIGIHQTYLGLGRAYTKVQEYDSGIYYLNEALKTDNIYTLSNAYLNLAQLKQEQKKFEEAIKYNVLSNQYTDSIYNISKTKEILELQAKYKHEALLSQQNLLKLENHNLTMYFLLTLCCMVCSFLVIMMLYQHRITKRERLMQAINKQIQSYTSQLTQNKEIIQRNNKQIKSMLTTLEGNQSLKEYINEQKIELNQTYKYNDYLQTQNSHLLDKITHHSQILREKENSIHSYEELKEENITLKEKEKLLSEYMSEQLELFKQLKEAPKYITDEQWSPILKTINIIYYNFTVRLHTEFPALTDSDLQICSLIKLRFATSMIATLTGVSPSSATKRKQRIKERMSQQYAELWNKEPSLEIYIWNY